MTTSSLKTKSEIEAWITTWISKETQLAESEINCDDTFVNFGLSSAQGIMFSGDISDWTGLNLDTSLIWDYPNIDRLSTYLAGQLAEASTKG